MSNLKWLWVCIFVAYCSMCLTRYVDNRMFTKMQAQTIIGLQKLKAETKELKDLMIIAGCIE